MEHNNYSKFFNRTENKDIVPEMEGQISFEEIVPEVEVTVEEPVENQVVEVETVVGVVSGCAKLNLRAEANVNSKVLTILNEDVELAVSPNFSTEDFYKVVTATGVEGYCMKKFITIK